MSEYRDEIDERARRIAIIAETIADRQAETQRLMTERSMLEAEIRGIEEAARLAHIRIPKAPNAANDDD